MHLSAPQMDHFRRGEGFILSVHMKTFLQTGTSFPSTMKEYLKLKFLCDGVLL